MWCTLQTLSNSHNDMSVQMERLRVVSTNLNKIKAELSSVLLEISHVKKKTDLKKENRTQTCEILK